MSLKIEKLVKFLIECWEAWPSILMGIASIFAICASAFPDQSWALFGYVVYLRYIFAFLAVICTVVGGFGQWRRKVSLRQLLQERERFQKLSKRYISDVEALLEKLLFQLVKECKLNKRNECKPEVRCSVYCKAPNDGDYFIAVSRISGNPAWKSLPKRRYPANWGGLKQCWQMGACCVRCDGFEEDAWVKEVVNRYDFPYDEAKQIRMQSQRMVFIRLTNRDGEPFGVLVIESIDKKVALKLVNDIGNSAFLPVLQDLLQIVQETHAQAVIQLGNEDSEQ